ncbi:MAG: toll/interleukin-1 receptor domain-containing protein [Chloroflexota bacterium]|nr:toll/interleukin-1 receptor domain-containing protein [Chloroflexota bacterium]MDQ5867566.1 toll/interleukin-1 receptor domain-containing protein [Chloroflexota bacterium]
MANEEHVRLLKQGIVAWNTWREDNPSVSPDLSDADLSRATLVGINLSGANLEGADLHQANLNGATLSRANLTEAYLAGANLFAANLIGAALGGANLAGASASEANFSGADLSGADLRMMDLYATDLTGAILNDAEFDATVLANLDLSSAIGLDTAIHTGPSSMGIDTLYRSNGAIPEVFLRGVGISDTFIQYVPSLVEQPIQFYSCFISYSHKDKAFARRLHDALQGSGIRCWLDEHQLLPGDKIHVEVDRGIRLWDRFYYAARKTHSQVGG